MLGDESGQISGGVLFAVMNVIMPPITCISSIVCEEREKGTLRGLIYAGIKPSEYFIGIGLCLGLLNFMNTCILLMINQSVSGMYEDWYLLLTGLASICSLLLGAIIGLFAKNQVSVAPIAAPLSLIIGMVSIFGLSNHGLHNVTQYLYSQAVLDMIVQNEMTIKGVVIIILNALILFGIFILMYVQRKKAD